MNTPQLVGGILLLTTLCGGAVTLPHCLKPRKEPTMPETRVTVVAVGDIMFHDPQIDHAWNGHAYDFQDTFSEIAPIVTGADIAVANFECVTAGKEVGYRGFPFFNAPDTTLAAVADAGFRLLTTANNHCLDQGTEGIEKTLCQINRNGMRHVGTDDPDAGIIPFVIEELHGMRLAFLAYTYGVNENEWKVRKGKPEDWVHLIDRDRMHRDIEAAKKDNPDVIVVSVHWGVEYAPQPCEEQHDLADFLFNEGVDVILGSHPHVVQGAESRIVNGRRHWVIYSMGNLVSNQRLETVGEARTEDGVIVRLSFVKGESRTGLDTVEFIPTWVNKYYDGSRIRYRIEPLDGTATAERPAASWKRTRKTLE
jgi:poly-gamma-glutamate synthesis protein (capsule biosynthesis protein)